MITGVKALLNFLVSHLRVFDVTSYVTSAMDCIREYCGWLNWLIPFQIFAKIYTLWLVCIGSYMIYRWIKPIIKIFITKLFS